MVDLIPIQRQVRPGTQARGRVSPNAFQNANPSAGLARVAGAASQVALTVDHHEQERLERDRKAKLGALRNQQKRHSALGIQEDFNTLKQSAEPGAPDFEENFQGLVAKRRQAALDAIGEDDPEARSLIEQDFDNLAFPFIADAQEFAAAERVRHRTELVDGSLQALGNSIVSSPDRFDAFYSQGLESIEAASPDLSPKGRQALLDGWRETSSMAAFNGMLEVDPQQALEDAQSKRFDKFWSPETKARAINSAQAEIKRREAEARARQAEVVDFRLADLEIAVRRGDAGEQELAAARKAGLFDKKPQKLVQLTTIADGVLADQIKEAEEAAELQLKLSSGTGLDSQDEADKAWGARTKQLDESNEQASLDHIAVFAAETGYVPTAMKRLVKNAERVDNPEQLALAAQTHDTLQASAPGADSGAGDRVALVSALVNDAGVDYEEAATQVLSGVPDSRVLQEREALLKEQKKKGNQIDFDEEAASRIPGLEGFFGGNRTSPGIATEMQSKYEQLFKLSGDQEVALAAAAEQMKREWGPSVFRDGNAMRYPPERYMPPALRQLGSDALKSVVDGDISPALSAQGLEGDYVLAPDVVETRKRAARGKPPAYRVMIQNDFGAMIPLADQNGDLVLYELPDNQAAVESDAYKKAVGTQRDILKRRGGVPELSEFDETAAEARFP